MARDLVLSADDKQNPPPATEQQIISWNAVTRKTALLYKLSDKDGLIREINWMTGSSSAIVVASYFQGEDPAQAKSSLFLVNSAGAVKNVAPVDTSEGYQVDPSPYRPQAAFVEYPPASTRSGDSTPQQEPGTIRFFSYDGVLSQPIKFPAPHSMLVWSADGRAYSLTFQRDSRAKTIKKIWSYVSSATHKFEPCEAPADFNAPEPTQEIGVVSLSATASFKKLGIRAPTIVATASDESKENDPGIVTTDGSDPALSPKLNAVCYISQDSLMVRPLVKVPLDAYRKAKDAALRTALLKRAKEVGLAMIMYAGDYDDNYPSNKGDWASLLTPYLRDSGAFDGFNYTFGGGNAANIESPADTQLGYIEGPGGRAVVFSDGHAKWIPNP